MKTWFKTLFSKIKGLFVRRDSENKPLIRIFVHEVAIPAEVQCSCFMDEALKEVEKQGKKNPAKKSTSKTKKKVSTKKRK